jgi:phosphoserine phosphatase RsbU/P
MEYTATEPAHILVIEDDPLVRFNLLSFLEDSGFAVSQADNGSTGVTLVREKAPDLVLCDLRMPGLDGLEVLRILHLEQPDLPLVAVSGTGVLGDAVDALRQGAWDFVTKPIQDMGVLEHAIGRTLDQARLVRENRRYQCELEQANRLLRDHVGRFEQDAIAGRVTQLLMMPQTPRQLGPYRFSRLLLPSLYLSGDFVDYFQIDGEHIGFFLADVSGHGVSSAFVTILLRSLVHRYLDQFRTEGDRTILDPAHLLARLSADLLDQRLDKYLTILFGAIDWTFGRLTYSNGGHCPNPILLAGGEARFLAGRGPPVGLLPDARFVNLTLDLPRTHCLSLFSDGVLDALAEPTRAGKRARLLAAVGRAGRDPEAVLDALGLDPEGAYPDDIAILLAERGMTPEEAAP